jgi:uncharacterized protein (TIGR03000 family)
MAAFSIRLGGIALGLLLAGIETASAQPRVGLGLGMGVASPPGWIGPGPNWRGNPGPGVGWNYYNTPGGSTTAWVGPGIGVWGWGGYPAAVGSFWTNGLSLYGPPVPTYAPIPGVFGGSDAHRHYVTPPVFGWGLNWYGYRSPSPRLASPSVSVHAPAAEASIVAGGPAPTLARAARMTIRLPHPDAVLWIDNQATKQTGTERAFESPELTEGQQYSYKLVAQWKVNGEEKAESRKVLVAAGQSMIVDFSKPE